VASLEQYKKVVSNLMTWGPIGEATGIVYDPELPNDNPFRLPTLISSGVLVFAIETELRQVDLPFALVASESDTPSNYTDL
jgi:hypothetical protein